MRIATLKTKVPMVSLVVLVLFLLGTTVVFAGVLSGNVSWKSIGNTPNSYLTIGQTDTSSLQSIALYDDNPKAQAVQQFTLLGFLLQIFPAIIFLSLLSSVGLFGYKFSKHGGATNLTLLVLSVIGFMLALALMPTIIDGFYAILSGAF